MTYETKPGVRMPKPEDNRPKRFYTDVSVAEGEGGWQVLLDGRSVKTPAKKLLQVPTKALAELLAAEWDAQGERIDAPLMPANRLSFVAIDLMGDAHGATVAEVTRYAANDQLCFRAPDPADLVAAQATAWDPMLDWARRELGVELRSGTGILPIEQDAAALQAVHARAAALDVWRLTALAHATAVCSSAVLGLALLEGERGGEAVFALSIIDEAYQIAQWGHDEEAAQRLDLLKAELIAAERLLRALDAS
ncbi:ATP12 family chaperone protein [Maricaulis sp.]|uniref:ATP12 family chaperone protein n=1 Tax=Maricaulis sp. TaxID=1486257 RepID=UPI003A914F3B